MLYSLILPLLTPFLDAPSLQVQTLAVETSACLAILVGVFAWLHGESLKHLNRKSPDSRAKLRYFRGDKRKNIVASLLKKGDEVLLSPDEEIPTDGVLISGSGFVDESELKGVDLPTPKKPGDFLFAGSKAAIPDGVMRTEINQEASYLSRRRRMERALSVLIYRSTTQCMVFSILSVLVVVAVIAMTWQRLTPGSWLSWCGLVSGLLLTGSGLVTVLVLGRTRSEAMGLGIDAGLLFSRLRDLERMGKVRRWQIDPRLLLQAQQTQVYALDTSVNEEQVLQVAQALTAEINGTLVSVLQDHFARVGREKFRAAALKENNGVFYGTVRGERWCMGLEGALKGVEKIKVDSEQGEQLSRWTNEDDLVWLIGKPGDKICGAILIAIDIDNSVAKMGRKLGAYLMPGLPDGVRQILASKSELQVDGPPIGRVDSSLVLESSPRPSNGLRVVVVHPSLELLIERGRSPRIMYEALSNVPECVSQLRSLFQRKRWVSFFSGLLPLLVGGVLAFLGWYGPWTAGLLLVGSGVFATNQLMLQDAHAVPNKAP